jgi:hypothetical protein
MLMLIAHTHDLLYYFLTLTLSLTLTFTFTFTFMQLNWASIVSLRNATGHHKGPLGLEVGQLRYVSSSEPTLTAYLCNVDNDEL